MCVIIHTSSVTTAAEAAQAYADPAAFLAANPDVNYDDEFPIPLGEWVVVGSLPETVLFQADSYEELFQQWQKEGRLAALTDAIDDAQDPTKRLDSIIAASVDPKLQAELGLVNEELKRNVSLIAQQREEAAGNLIQSAALVAETIANYNIRLANLQKSRQQALDNKDEASATLFATAIENGRSALDGAVAIYIDNLATGTRYTDAVIQAQFQRIKEELDRKPVLGKSLVTRATLFVRHVGNYRKQQRADPATILKELLAASGQR